MIQALIYIIIGYFLLGAIAIAIINKRNTNYKAQDRWTKYVFYLIVVICTVIFIYFKSLPYLSLFILGIGLKEVIMAWKKSEIRSKTLLIKALLYFGITGAAFFYYSTVELTDFHLFVYTIVFVFDGFAQISGQLFGKHKIFPKISPEKTGAGIAGGYISALITAYLIADIINVNANKSIFMALIIATAAMIGDLSASLFKRKCNIKDYSNLIPGHGGILDRFDSYILAGAVSLIFIEG